jgi:hypothetical protein
MIMLGYVFGEEAQRDKVTFHPIVLAWLFTTSADLDTWLKRLKGFLL